MTDGTTDPDMNEYADKIDFDQQISSSYLLIIYENNHHILLRPHDGL